MTKLVIEIDLTVDPNPTHYENLHDKIDEVLEPVIREFIANQATVTISTTIE